MVAETVADVVAEATPGAHAAVEATPREAVRLEGERLEAPRDIGLLGEEGVRETVVPPLLLVEVPHPRREAEGADPVRAATAPRGLEELLVDAPAETEEVIVAERDTPVRLERTRRE